MPLKTKLPLLVLSVSILAVSCGKNGGGSKARKTSTQSELVEEGTYKAILRPLNIHLSGFIPTGAAEIKIDGDNFVAKTLLDDDAQVPHMQSIHSGSRCPNASDDKNRDGVIDLTEAIKASGKVVVPLDNELNSADEGKGIYPVGSGFTYVEEASLTKLESDVKQRTGRNLNLKGRVVLIHGVAGHTPLPIKVKHSEVPVVCGILKKI